MDLVAEVRNEAAGVTIFRRPAALLVVLCIAGVTAFASATLPPPERTFALTVRHSRFSASDVHVKRGQTVTFVVRNTDPIDHELIVGPASVHERHESGREAWHPPVDGELSVRLFDTGSTSYTFDEAGTVLFGCHLPGHWAYGMRGRVVVS